MRLVKVPGDTKVMASKGIAEYLPAGTKLAAAAAASPVEEAKPKKRVSSSSSSGSK